MSSTIDIARALIAMREAGLIPEETPDDDGDRPELPEPVGPAEPWTPPVIRRELQTASR